MSTYRQVGVIVVWLVNNLATAQNIVPNASFESIKKRPCSGVYMNGDNIANYVNNWVAPTGGTSDLQATDKTYDSCSIGLSKYNLSARTGQFCAGFFTVSTSPAKAAAAGIKPYREYLQVRLKTRLIPTRIYYVEFYVSPFDVRPQLTTSCYTNNIGCVFSLDSINRPLNGPNSTEPLAYTPQINETAIMDQPGKWRKISGCFEAKEAAQFLTIGNFYTDSDTKYIEGNLGGLGAYYVIDDVSVIETNLTKIPQLALQDTTLCPNQPIILTLDNNADITYQWQDSSHASQYKISSPGLYSVSATSGQCVISRTFSCLEPLKVSQWKVE